MTICVERIGRLLAGLLICFPVMAMLFCEGTLARAEVAGKPGRIVSLNLCTDQILVDLVAPQRIVALSFLAPDPSVSAIAGRVKGARTVRGEAEEILSLDADLVISVTYSTPATISILRQLGKHVVTTPLATSFADIRTSIRTLAEATGDPERGEALIEDFDRRLQTMKPGDESRPSALAVQVGSLVSSSGSLLGEALDWVGLRNDAATRVLGRGGRLPLEALVADPPDLIVLANDPAEFRSAAADNLRHPALQALVDRRPHLILPLPTWLCGSPAVLEGMQQLSRAREDVVLHGRGRGWR